MELNAILALLSELAPVFDPKDANKVFKLTDIIQQLDAIVQPIIQDQDVWPAVVKLYEESRKESGI